MLHQAFKPFFQRDLSCLWNTGSRITLQCSRNLTTNPATKQLTKQHVRQPKPPLHAKTGAAVNAAKYKPRNDTISKPKVYSFDEGK
jgi:hypothetical protein